MKKLLKEFKEFALRGNVMDMAVGIIIGGAFTAIVSALVDSILMPIIGMISGGMSVDPDDKTPGAIKDTGAKVVTYGPPYSPVPCFCLHILMQTENRYPS